MGEKMRKKETKGRIANASLRHFSVTMILQFPL